MEKESEKTNCIKCKHYYITWDKKNPKGCKAYGFKSATVPSMLVQKTSGRPCMLFDEKTDKDAYS